MRRDAGIAIAKWQHGAPNKRPGREKPWTEKLWVYDLRTNKHFTLKTNPLKRTDLAEVIST